MVTAATIFRLHLGVGLGAMAALAQTPQPSPEAVGQQLFSARCAGCHGLDAMGGEHAPNIATSAEVRRLSDSGIATIVREGIPAAGMPAFGSSFDSGQVSSIVKYLRSLQGSRGAVSSRGKAAGGRALFFGKAGCSGCHMVAGQGGFLAGDLTGYGGSHSAAEIREAILNPNKDSDPRQRSVDVVTRSGQKYRGVLRNEDNSSLQMQEADGSFHFFDKSELARVERADVSLMPSDYGSKLTKTEVDDLVAYLAEQAEAGIVQTKDHEEE